MMNTASRQELFCIIFCRCPGLHCLVLENREIYVKRDKRQHISFYRWYWRQSFVDRVSCQLEKVSRVFMEPGDSNRMAGKCWHEGLGFTADFLWPQSQTVSQNWILDSNASRLSWCKLNPTTFDSLKRQVKQHNISGRCFPLISSNDKLLKKLGVKSHLIKRKIMLKAMDAILFGPPVYDNTVKGNSAQLQAKDGLSKVFL